MAEMPNLGPFTKGGAIINNGTLMTPVIDICLHLLALRNMVPVTISPLFIFCRISLLKAKAAKHLSSQRDFATDRWQIAHDSIRVTGLVDEFW